MSQDSGDLLQHPRRNLGNRYRSQSQKFVGLANRDRTRFEENMSWAEQNARQALEISDRGYILVTGKNAYEGKGDYLLNDKEIRKAFLGG